MPTPTNYQTNSMPTYENMAPGLNANGQIQNIAYVKRYVTKTDDYTVKSTESGTFFNNAGATKAIVFTLPAISTGPWHFEFFVAADQSVTVTAGTADTLMTFNDLAADSIAFSTASEKIGGRILIDCDGTSLMGTAFGVSHRQTATVTT